MRKLLSLGLFIPSLVVAAPFVATDPTSAVGVTQCGVYMDATAKVVIPVTAVTGGNMCKFDAVAISPGSHIAQMTFIVNDPIWGALEGPKSLPLSFTRPGVPGVPTGLGLIP